MNLHDDLRFNDNLFRSPLRHLTKSFLFRFVDGECGSSSGDSTGQLELSGGEQPEEASPASMHETNNNSLLHEDLERRIP